jgi:hypothetical protein
MNSVESSTMFFKAVLLCKSLLKFVPLSARNVYNYLWRHHGACTSKLFGELVKTRIQICKLNLAILFIRTCRSENLVPTFVRFRVAIPRLANYKLIQRCRDDILRDELKFKRHLLSQTAKHMARLDRELKETVSHIVYVRLVSISNEIVNKKLVAIEHTH